MKSEWGNLDCLLIYIISAGKEALGSYWSAMGRCAIESME